MARRERYLVGLDVGTSKITGTLKGTLKTGTSMISLILKYRLKNATARHPG